MAPAMSGEGNKNIKIEGKRWSEGEAEHCREKGPNSARQIKEDFQEEVRPKLSQRRNY